MVRLYVCENCGKQSDDQNDFKTLQWLSVEPPYEAEDDGEFCTKCKEKIKKFVKEGFQ